MTINSKDTVWFVEEVYYGKIFEEPYKKTFLIEAILIKQLSEHNFYIISKNPNPYFYKISKNPNPFVKNRDLEERYITKGLTPVFKTRSEAEFALSLSNTSYEVVELPENATYSSFASMDDS